MTIFLRLLLFGYFLANMVDVLNMAQNDITYSQFRRNLSFDPHSFNLTKNEFDMGLYVSYFGETVGVQDEIDTYFIPKFYQIYFMDDPNTWGTGLDWQLFPIHIEKC